MSPDPVIGPDPVMRPDPALANALAPVSEALLAAAHGDACRQRDETNARCDHTMARAQAEAAQIGAQARADGTADAAAAIAIDRAQGRRDARAAVLRARRDTEQRVRVAAQAQLASIRSAPTYPDLRDRLVATVHILLGQHAQVREAAEGGVIGEVAGRRVDFSLAGFVDRATDTVLAEVASAEFASAEVAP
jgi:hypothetical protein